MGDYGKEEVLVIPTNTIIPWEGVKTKNKWQILETISQNAFLMLRNEAEGNPQVTQIIPYCVLSHTDSEGTKRLFHAQRKSEADRELKGKWTIGIGGHINPEDRVIHSLSKKQKKIMNLDKDLIPTLLACVKRELSEELVCDRKDVMGVGFICLLMTKADSVSKDHLGVVLKLEMATRNVNVKPDGELAKGFFATELEFLIYLDWHDFLLSIHTPEEIKKYGW